MDIHKNGRTLISDNVYLFIPMALFYDQKLLKIIKKWVYIEICGIFPYNAFFMIKKWIYIKMRGF